MKFPFFVLSTVIFLAGCQSTAFDLKDDVLFQQTIPVCTTDDECKKIWTAARQWVMKMTPQGLAIDTAERIQTRAADDESFNWETDITVSKVPLGNGQYQIIMETWCSMTINSCDTERRLMRRFNKDMARYVSSGQSQEVLRIFAKGDDINALFSSYAASLTEADLHKHARKYYLPTTVISGDNVRQLDSTDEVIAFLKETRARIGDGKIARIEAHDRQLLASGKTTTIVKLQWKFYDASDDLQYTQKATYNLVKVGKGWKIIFVSFDE
ncbi:MAG TPA: hypothetical protein ENI94_04350 [Gammaproteobacteria bacterium]|nr:hypothetical protein [Gammaproteobacteria bacterium]